MRLLIITQKIDRDDTVLGFMHRWVEDFAGAFKRVSVLCLQSGRVELPPEVPVYSLGKERQQNRLRYLINFYRVIIGQTNTYDEVFVHMNPEYVLWGWAWWRMTGKKIVLWYNHPVGSLSARVARCLVDRVVCTSPFAYAMRWQGTERMPVGVDTNQFSPRGPYKRNRVVYVGRLSPVKKIELLIDAAKILQDQGCDVAIQVYGNPTDADTAYARAIQERAAPQVAAGIISFHAGVLHDALPEIFSAAHVVVNMTPTGSFDKTIIEAMACERLVLVSNRALAGVIPPECLFEQNNARALADQLQIILGWSAEDSDCAGKKMRAYAVQDESLSELTKKLHDLFSKLRERL